MKICSVNNYTNTGYINETLIYNKISTLLGVGVSDSFTFTDLNSAYNINKNYSHLLIYFDYKATSIQGYDEFLKEVKIPKIFIIDTIPQKHEEVNKEFIDRYIQNEIYGFTSLPQSSQNHLYSEHADGLVFFNDLDKDLFNQFYTISDTVPRIVIPPSLGKKENLKINFDNFLPNNNIGYNGVPSYANGFTLIGGLFPHIPKYNLNIFGTHGRLDYNNELLLNDILPQVTNIKFNGRLKNQDNFFKSNHIYSNLSIYDSFDYFTFLSLLNGMVPLLTNSSSTSSFFKSYPFIANPDPNSIKYTLNLISSAPPNYLRDILNNSLEFIKELNDEDTLEKYHNFLKNI